MGIKLFEIEEMLRQAISEAEKQIDETGEVSKDWADFLNDIKLEKEKKCLSVAVVIKEFEAEKKAIEVERKKMQSRELVLKNKTDRLEMYLKSCVSVNEKFKDLRAKISWRKSQIVNIINEDNIPDEYIRIKREPMKTEIKEFLKTNIVDWAEIKENNNIQIK